MPNIIDQINTDKNKQEISLQELQKVLKGPLLRDEKYIRQLVQEIQKKQERDRIKSSMKKSFESLMYNFTTSDSDKKILTYTYNKLYGSTLIQNSRPQEVKDTITPINTIISKNYKSGLQSIFPELEKKQISTLETFPKPKEGFDNQTIRDVYKWAQGLPEFSEKQRLFSKKYKEITEDSQLLQEYIQKEIVLYALGLYLGKLSDKQSNIAQKHGYTNESIQKTTKWIELMTKAEQNNRERFPEFNSFQQKSENYQKIFKKSKYTVESYKAKQQKLGEFNKQMETVNNNSEITTAIKRINNIDINTMTDNEAKQYLSDIVTVKKMQEQIDTLRKPYQTNEWKSFFDLQKKLQQYIPTQGEQQSYNNYMEKLTAMSKAQGINDMSGELKKYNLYIKDLKKGINLQQRGLVSSVYAKIQSNNTVNFPHINMQEQKNQEFKKKVEHIHNSIKENDAVGYQVLNAGRGLWEGFWNGIAGMGKTVTMLKDMALGTSTDEMMINQEILNLRQQKFTGEKYQSSEQNRSVLDKNGNLDFTLTNTINQVGQGVAQMFLLIETGGVAGGAMKGIGIGANIASKAGLVTSSMLMSMGGSFDQGMKQGFSSKEAVGYALLQSGVQGGLELISPNKILTGKMSLSNPLTKSLVKNFAKGLGKEIGEEILQEELQLLAEKGINYLTNSTLGSQLDTKLTVQDMTATAILTGLTTGVASGKGKLQEAKISTKHVMMLEKIGKNPTLAPIYKASLERLIVADLQNKELYTEMMKHIQDVINEHTAKIAEIEGRKTREVNENVGNNSNQKTIESTQDIQPLLTTYPDILKNIVNPEILQTIIQSEMASGNLILNTDGSIKEVYTEVGGEKKPSQLFEKMKADGFSEQQALKTWLQVRTPEFKNRFGDRKGADKSQVSKVVDENGEPLVVYHRTENSFTEFDNDKISYTSSGKGHYFSFDNKGLGRSGLGDNSYITFLNLRNPYNNFDIENGMNTYSSEINKYIIDYIINTPNLKEITDNVFIKRSEQELLSLAKNVKESNDFSFHSMKEINKSISDQFIYNLFYRERGYDGAVIKHGYRNEVMVLDPKNIKSAIDNDGSFSAETAKFNDYFGKESRFGFDSKQTRENSTFMDTTTDVAQIRDRILTQYESMTGQKIELTDAQIQTIIETHLKPGELGKLTQAELSAKTKSLATAITDPQLRRFLLEAGFCGTDRMISNTEEIQQLLGKIFELGLHNSLDQSSQEILENSLLTKIKPKLGRSDGLKINEFIQNSKQVIDLNYNKIHEIKNQLSNNLLAMSEYRNSLSYIPYQSLDECFHNLGTITSTINNFQEQIDINLSYLIEIYSNNPQIIEKLKNIKSNLQGQFNEIGNDVTNFTMFIGQNYDLMSNNQWDSVMQKPLSERMPKIHYYSQNLIETFSKASTILNKHLEELNQSIKDTYK